MRGRGRGERQNSKKMESVAEFIDLGLKRSEPAFSLASSSGDPSLGPARLLAGQRLRRFLEHRHVTLGEVGEHVWPERAAHRRLVFLERIHRRFQVWWHRALHLPP